MRQGTRQNQNAFSGASVQEPLYDKLADQRYHSTLPQHTIMADLNDLFAPSSALSPDIMGELESMLRLYSISPQELFYKWESYSLKMGSEDTKLNLETVRMFKKDVQDGLERDTHGRHVGRGSERKSNVAATPRGATTSGDVFGMQVS